MIIVLFRSVIAAVTAALSDAPWMRLAGSGMRSALIFIVLLSSGCAGSASGEPSDDGACARRVLESEVTNARDLGGWPVAGGRIACRRILRGGALNGLTAKGCTEFAELGIRTIIDLRERAVQETTPPPVCTTQGATHVSASMPKLLPDTPEHYLALLEQAEAIQQIFSVLREATSYPVYLHCEIGRDRASFATALLLLALGATRQTVMAEFSLSTQAGVTINSNCLAAVLDEIATRGGIEAFLASSGVEGPALDALHQHAVQ